MFGKLWNFDLITKQQENLKQSEERWNTKKFLFLAFYFSSLSRVGLKGVKTLVEVISKACEWEPLPMLFPFVRNYLLPFIWLMVMDQ